MFQPGQQIGPYILLRILGRGAYGEVWLAEKRGSLLTTQVALKLPVDPETDIDAIQKEAQTWLHASGHPNVLPVIDAEVFDGQVVIASEYASGGSLKQWLRQNGGKSPSIDAAISMASGILAGLEHLHALQPQPIIHRDLKSDNVLLQGGIPRITDFGISRVLKTTACTQHATGTPSYMPPEAFEGHYSVQSDIWAVGVLLYQMLSGRLPFPQEDLPSLYGAIKQRDYPPLPTDVPPFLKEAVAKALAKDTAHRFATASEMRAALNVKPRSVKSSGTLRGARERLSTNSGRGRYAPVLLSVLLGLALLTIFALVAAKIKAGRQTPIRLSANSLAFHFDRKLPGIQWSVSSLAWSPDSKWIVTGTADGIPKIWDAETGQELKTLKGCKASVLSVAWSPNKEFIVAGSDRTAKIWDAETGQELKTLKGHGGWVASVAWSPDSESLVTGSNEVTVRLWERASGHVLRPLKGNKDSVNAVAWSPVSQIIVTGGDRTANIWDAVTGQEVSPLTGHKGAINAVAWSPDGKYIATGSSDRTAKIWDAATGEELKTLRGHTDSVLSVAWLSDSHRVVTGSNDTTAKIWDAMTGDVLQTLSGHTGPVLSVACSPDGQFIVTGGSDTTANIWKVFP